MIDVFKNTWIHKLCHDKNIYAYVTTKALMDHLQLHCIGLQALNVVDLTSNILTNYVDAEGVPKYINMLEDAQKKDQYAQLPAPNATLMAIYPECILQAQAFIPEMKEWENNLPENKTWSLCKSTFIKAHEGLQRQIQACGGADQFGSANAVTVVANPPRSVTGVTPNILY